MRYISIYTSYITFPIPNHSRANYQMQLLYQQSRYSNSILTTNSPSRTLYIHRVCLRMDFYFRSCTNNTQNRISSSYIATLPRAISSSWQRFHRPENPSSFSTSWQVKDVLTFHYILKYLTCISLRPITNLCMLVPLYYKHAYWHRNTSVLFCTLYSISQQLISPIDTYHYSLGIIALSAR